MSVCFVCVCVRFGPESRQSAARGAACERSRGEAVPLAGRRRTESAFPAGAAGPRERLAHGLWDVQNPPEMSPSLDASHRGLEGLVLLEPLLPAGSQASGRQDPPLAWHLLSDWTTQCPCGTWCVSLEERKAQAAAWKAIPETQTVMDEAEAGLGPSCGAGRGGRWRPLHNGPGPGPRAAPARESAPPSERLLSSPALPPGEPGEGDDSYLLPHTPYVPLLKRIG